MIDSGNNPIVKIVGVERIACQDGTYCVAPREYAVLAFRVKGSVEISGGGADHFAKANDVLYVPQNMGYTARYTGSEIIFIHFVTAEDDRQIKVFSFQNSEQIYGAFLRLLALWRNKEPGYLLYAMEQVYGVLGMLYQSQTQAVLPEHFLEAISFINANYRNHDVSIEQICANAGIGATTLRQLFKKYYQKTPLEYITNLRLEQARSLIASGMPIETASYESGFNDPKYFARVVKKHFNCTPRDLKNYGR